MRGDCTICGGGRLDRVYCTLLWITWFKLTRVDLTICGDGRLERFYCTLLWITWFRLTRVDCTICGGDWLEKFYCTLLWITWFKLTRVDCTWQQIPNQVDACELLREGHTPCLDWGLLFSRLFIYYPPTPLWRHCKWADTILIGLQ